LRTEARIRYVPRNWKALANDGQNRTTDRSRRCRSSQRSGAPIAPISVDDADEAVVVANDTNNGLVDSALTGGDSNIEEFTERRWLTVNPGPAHYPY
jgi:hypothetical protein